MYIFCKQLPVDRGQYLVVKHIHIWVANLMDSHISELTKT